MAKKGRTSRGPHVTANGDPLRGLLDPLPSSPVDTSVDWTLADVEDRRRSTPEVSPLPRMRDYRPSKVVPAPAAYTYTNGSRSRSRSFNQMAFELPRETVVCVRRQTRKEVLFAKKRFGKNGPGKRGPWSHVHCKRK